MKIWVRGAATNDVLENFVPYDSRTFNLVAGTYEFTTRIFSKSKAGGIVCEEKSFTFTIENCASTAPCDGQVTGLSFISRDRTKTVDLMDGETICLGDIDFNRGNVRFATNGTVGSMRIKISGAVSVENVENFRPYDSRKFDIVAGTYVIATRIHSESKEGGTVCEEKIFEVIVEDCTPVDPCALVTPEFVLGGDVAATDCDANGTIIIENVEAPTVPNGFVPETVWITGDCNNIGALQQVNVGEVYNAFIAAGGFDAGIDPSIPGTSWQFITDNDGDDLQLTINQRPRACYLRCTRVPECTDRFLGETHLLEVFDDCIDDECSDISMVASGETVTVSNVVAHASAIQILNASNSQVAGCTFNCRETESFDLPTGKYLVIVRKFNTAFGQICEKITRISINGALTNDAASSSRSASAQGALAGSSYQPTALENNQQSTAATTITTNGISLRSISVFPNPAQNEVSVDLSSVAGQSGQITVFNQMGQLLQTVELDAIDATPVQVKMSDLPTGVYHFMIVANGQLIGNEKVVKQ